MHFYGHDGVHRSDRGKVSVIFYFDLIRASGLFLLSTAPPRPTLSLLSIEFLLNAIIE
jgi:hypothetical protein